MRPCATISRQKRLDIWQWYASNKVRDEQAEAVRFELLKSTYRLERETQPEIYATAEDVARKLGLDSPVTIYQAQNPQGLNASLAYVPGEAHIVLHGPVSFEADRGRVPGSAGPRTEPFSPVAVVGRAVHGRRADSRGPDARSVGRHTRTLPLPASFPSTTRCSAIVVRCWSWRIRWS